MKIERRGFLKLGAAIVGTMTITRYAEPVLQSLPEKHEWIEDRGDFVIVRVPDFKSFAREHLDKPAIFLMGQQAAVQDVYVRGFSNFYAPQGGIVSECCFDASGMATETARPVCLIKGRELLLKNSRLIGNYQTTALALK